MLVRDLIAFFPEIRPVAGAAGLDRSLRWVHVVEQPDVAHWLRSGDFVLVSGVGWPRDARQQREAVRQMGEVGVAGVLFATGRFLPSVPQAVRSAAEEIGLPIIEAPFGLRFAEIAEAAQRTIIGEYFEVTERADAIHRALTVAAAQAADLNALAGQLAALLGVGVSIHQGDGTRIARAGDGDGRGRRLPDRVLASLEAANPGDLPLRLQIGGRESLLMPVRAGNESVGHLLLERSSAGFGPLEERVIQHAAAVIALHMLRQKEIADVERRIHASFLEALLAGAYPPQDRAARERVRLHGLDPDAPLRIVIARLELAGPALTSRREFEMRRSLAGIIEGQCRASRVTVLSTVMLSRVVLLWPAGPQDRALLSQLHQSAAAAVAGRLVLAAGEAQEGIAGIPKSFSQAEQLLLLAGGGDTLLLYEDHLLVRLLAGLESHALRTFRDAVLGPFDRERNGRALLETIRALTACGGSQVEAARLLGLHRNTLRQRLQRIAEILGRPLSDAEAMARVHLALVADRLLGASSTP